MIKHIFFDLDETLIYTSFAPPEQKHMQFTLTSTGPAYYYTIFRPCAKPLIEFARELVGNENVMVLTTSTEDYANTINTLGEFGFSPDQIFPREMLEKFAYPGAYGATCYYSKKDIADENNVLIDNLPPTHNKSKMTFLGIGNERYIQCRDYYGVNFPNDTFESDVKKRLAELT